MNPLFYALFVFAGWLLLAALFAAAWAWYWKPLRHAEDELDRRIDKKLEEIDALPLGRSERPGGDPTPARPLSPPFDSESSHEILDELAHARRARG